MEIIVLPRQGGKTTKMLEWIRGAPEGEHRVIVCPTGQEAMRLLRENPDLESWRFVSMDEVRPGGGGWSGVLYGRGGRMVLGIDNLDLMLSRLFGWEVGAFSASD